uniref:Peptidase C1A papain C-terminal domain-containing protein n=1 Tax=Chromera velia CCMP2878 TaxID=1169474 RepID=A0A0G4GYZ7_9ALVE|mmetsp:Transcript_44352/g.87597  ORF Transcript_44352/g.87597 Transcript_44352/m.87597 type:complete len:422 (-) Transcript_44352:1163-2428(-)|eukprot:Cvel_23984.t1-p1 / transcript=Cvel_23984.t1 / gene=Cvel_23984 / organism=Chromera_velia_CCMP2878 / gene_product=Tubulointerstitial nephritis antigen-like, putative / transcript_product=Tubulointerstitial nephritis antigen-like, putative / location=Cvel_scaffold2540:22707-25181(+) / protein_length=421 / sequence_SO=supercontig / SO=protein_coding / is_pseudo=false
MTDLKKVRAAASKHGKGKGKKNQWFGYVVGIGGVSVATALAVLVVILNPDRKPHQIPVNDEWLISRVQSDKIFEAGPVEHFEDHTLADVRRLSSNGVSPYIGGVPGCALPPAGESVPTAFDARKEWPKCLKAEPYDSKNCTSSWAIATASSIADRFCISDPETHAGLELAPQTILSCDSKQRGCQGGDTDAAFRFAVTDGLVSEECFPFEPEGKDVTCSQKCSNEKPLKLSSFCVVSGAEPMMRDILTNGPAVAMLVVYDDFLVYKGGVYTPGKTSHRIVDPVRRNYALQAVKVIGWGVDIEKGRKTQPYWLIENSWGADWGQNGIGKIARGDSDQEKKLFLNLFTVAGVVPPVAGKMQDQGGDGSSPSPSGDDDGQQVNLQGGGWKASDLDDAEVDALLKEAAANSPGFEHLADDEEEVE